MAQPHSGAAPYTTAAALMPPHGEGNPTPQSLTLSTATGTLTLSTARHRAATLAHRAGGELTQSLALTLELVAAGYTYSQAEALAADMTASGEG